ncbi:MAG: molecular chaperone DnaK, partial [Nitrospinota bacterium]|nr:molecular chaperone DnaK [Nitrospinota bacterium]
NKDKLPESDRKPLEEALEKAKKALESNNAEEIKKEMENLTQASHKLAEVMYKQQSEPASSGQTPPGANQGKKPSGDDVVDAEFEDSGKKE